jgi:hypothetical protein
MEEYNVILKVTIAVIAYGITWFLVKFGRISLLTHRKIWNVLLLITFLISCLLGLLIAFLIDQGSVPSWYIKILRLHVNAGIFMTVIALFHTFGHFRYYVAIFKKSKFLK